MYSKIARSVCRVSHKYNTQNCAMAIHQTVDFKTIDDMGHPNCLPLLGTKLDLMLGGGGTMLHQYIDRRHKQLGPIFYEKLGSDTKLVFVSDPQLIKTVFLSLEGKYPMHILPEPWLLYEKLYGSKRGLLFMNSEEWFTNRRLMNKHLLREGSIEWMDYSVKKTVEQFVRGWKERVEKGNTKVNLESDFYKLSTQVMLSVLFGAETSSKCGTHSDKMLSNLSETVKKVFQTTTKLYGWPLNICQRLNLKVWRNFKESVDASLFLGTIVQTSAGNADKQTNIMANSWIINTEKTFRYFYNVLSLRGISATNREVHMLHNGTMQARIYPAQSLVLEVIMKREGGDGLVHKLLKDNVTDETVVRLVADFILAAGDTTAYTSIWSLYLLAQNEEIKEEIRMRDSGYVKNVLKESMRLYPVAPFLTRILPKDCILGEYKLKEHTPIIASIYTSGRDEQYFSKADIFLPYRWDRNDPRKKDLHNHMPSASMPFALGARSCIGQKLAMLQLTELLTQIVHNFDFKCTNIAKVLPVTSQVLVPKDPVQLTISHRKI